ncbi:uncharacterized protein P884DRAFT_262008 [Thermothelomyces heterothallicus CBS 202.75]|uniref:uncharacterized protein n=1 Tax=Thermothelomyces heterothallicus CBS 202.75 TaxID=1149848 RepID=UPI0037430458
MRTKTSYSECAGRWGDGCCRSGIGGKRLPGNERLGGWTIGGEAEKACGGRLGLFEQSVCLCVANVAESWEMGVSNPYFSSFTRSQAAGIRMLRVRPVAGQQYGI